MLVRICGLGWRQYGLFASESSNTSSSSPFTRRSEAEANMDNSQDCLSSRILGSAGGCMMTLEFPFILWIFLSSDMIMECSLQDMLRALVWCIYVAEKASEHTLSCAPIVPMLFLMHTYYKLPKGEAENMKNNKWPMINFKSHATYGFKVKYSKYTTEVLAPGIYSDAYRSRSSLQTAEKET